jgi:hypothetical protein
VEPVLVVGIVVFAILVASRVIAARRAATGESRLVAVVFLPALVGGLVGVWAGIKVIGLNLPVGLILLAMGCVTTVLVARMILSRPDAASQLVSTGELSGPHFDYIIWIALGIPALLVLALAILAVTGGLAPR